MDIELAASALSAIAASVTLADTVYKSLCRFKETRIVEAPVAPSYLETVTATGHDKVLRHTVDGRVERTITRDELPAFLTEAEMMDVEKADKEMAGLVREWVAITRSPAPLAPAEFERLDEISKGLAAHLRRVTSLLERLGFHLHDHYDAMRRIAAVWD